MMGSEDAEFGKVTTTRMGRSCHVLMVPYPSPPHITPMLHLARQLVASGDFTITLVSFQVLTERLVPEESIHFVGVPDDLPGFNPPSYLPLEPKVWRETLQLGHNMRPFIDKLLQERQNPTSFEGPTVMISDYLNSWTGGVAAELNIPRFVLSANSASFVLTFIVGWDYARKHLELRKGDSDLIHMPNLPPLYYRELPGVLRNGIFSQEQLLAKFTGSGVLVNTFFELEAEAIGDLAKKLQKPVLPIGPLGLSAHPAARNGPSEGSRLTDDGWKDWMDGAPPASVLYVNFGTTGLNMLSVRHVHELAKGLETSEERFLLVLRAPPEWHMDDSDDLLPVGFEERVKGRGLILKAWAPQTQILAHPSTGAFLSSCGWNSVMESMSVGVPILAWPSFADQPVSSRFIANKAKVAVALRQQADFFVEAEEIAKSVKLVLRTEEGKAMRERMTKVKGAAAIALAEGGSTRQSILELANLLRHSCIKNS